MRRQTGGAGYLLSVHAAGILRRPRQRAGDRLAGSDSLSLREFRGCGLNEETPDHVTISRTRRLVAAQAVFGWVLREVARRGLLKGKTVGIDATTLEANAAMKSIVRRDGRELHGVFTPAGRGRRAGADRRGGAAADGPASGEANVKRRVGEAA